MEPKKPNSPVFLFVLAVLLLLGAGGAYLGMGSVNQVKEAQIAASLPEQVSLRAFDPATHSNEMLEVRVRAQLDLDMDFDLIAVTAEGKEIPGRMIALLAEDARPGDPTLGALIITDELTDADYAWLQANKVSEGAVGPVIALQGVLAAEPGAWQGAVAALHSEEGRRLGEAPLLLRPFFEPREQFFALIDPAFFAAVPGVLSLLFNIFGFRQVGRRKRWRMGGGDAFGMAGAVGAVSEAAGLPAFADTGQTLGGQTMGAVHAQVSVDQPLPVGPGGIMVTIAPYAPQMVDGTDGAVLMRKLLANSSGRSDLEVYSPEKPGLEAFKALEQASAAKDPFANLPGQGTSHTDRLLGTA